ncbi:MAG: TlpA family protein disulfide reductase [Candidatus Dormibacteria bacterium]
MSRRAAVRRKQQRRAPRRAGRSLWIGGSLAGAAVTAVLIGLALRASSPAASVGQATPRVSVTSPAGGSAQVGDRASGFTATTVAGQTFQVPAGRPTVLYFMAGWCSSCRPEAQALGQIDSQRHGQVAILAVDADPTDPLASLQNFIAQVGNPGYAFVQDEGGALVQAFGATALDTTVVIDGNGRVVYRNTRPIDEQTLEAALARAGSQ